MNKHDASVFKALVDSGAIEQPELTPEQEEMLARALDSEKEFLHKVENLFKTTPKK